MPAEKNYLIDNRPLEGLSDDQLLAKYAVAEQRRRQLESQSKDAYRAALLSEDMLADMPKLMAVSAEYDAVMQLRINLWAEAHRREITNTLRGV